MAPEAPSTTTEIEVEVDLEEGTGAVRIDRYLADQLELPRNRIQQWLANGLIRVGGSTVRASRRLVAGELISIDPPPPTDEANGLTPEDEPIELLHLDHELAVIDKPAGLVVHPGAGNRTGTLAHRLAHHFPELRQIGHPLRPGIVHRLDQGTSGAMVVARTEGAYRALTAAFAERRVDKVYLAIAWGSPPSRRILDEPIGRHGRDRTKMATRPGGRPARTEVRRIATVADGAISFLAIRLHTGRTHQIRVHLKAAGHPLLGDPVYGEARWKALQGSRCAAARRFSRPALHAWRLGFDHPSTGQRLECEAPLPTDLCELWSELGGDDLVALAAQARKLLLTNR